MTPTTCLPQGSVSLLVPKRTVLLTGLGLFKGESESSRRDFRVTGGTVTVGFEAAKPSTLARSGPTVAATHGGAEGEQVSRRRR